jgi:small subunit ribosomal protein S1
VPDTDTLTAPAGIAVEGSGGLLLEIDGQIVPNYDATLVPFDEGDVVTGKVVRIDKDEVLVDIGYKSEGVILSNELSIRKSANPFDEVEMGEEVDALVLTKEDQDGRLILSKKRARFEKAWRRIEAAAESGEPVEGAVIEVVKGGLIIDLGVRGFLPASLVDIRRVQNLDDFLGQKIECKVIELNRSRNNVVLSRRAVLEEERKEVRQQILDRLQPGQIVEGAISNIVDFGAFVDLDGIDGLIHISELSWSHVNHPSEILSIGDVVPVKVLDIDRERQRISLGLKQTQEDPWQRVVDTYNLGDELEGKVTKVVSFGAFVEILDGVEGLVHISELANHHVENPREVVNQGDVIRVKILEIDSERRRLSLSAKRVEDQVLPLRSAADVPGPGSHVEGELTGDEDLGEVRDLGLSEDVFAPGGDPTALGDGTAADEQAAAAEALDVDQVVPLAEAEAAAPVGDEAAAGVGDEAAAPTGDEAAAPVGDEEGAPAGEALQGEAAPDVPEANVAGDASTDDTAVDAAPGIGDAQPAAADGTDDAAPPAVAEATTGDAPPADAEATTEDAAPAAAEATTEDAPPADAASAEPETAADADPTAADAAPGAGDSQPAASPDQPQ